MFFFKQEENFDKVGLIHPETNISVRLNFSILANIRSQNFDRFSISCYYVCRSYQSINNEIYIRYTDYPEHSAVEIFSDLFFLGIFLIGEHSKFKCRSNTERIFRSDLITILR